jgi:hypothetical protein
MSPRPFKRAGLHKLECGCGNYTYSAVAALERYGLPDCRCGQPFEPTELELAFMLGLDNADVVREYQRRTVGSEMAQARGVGSWQRTSERLAAGTLRPMSVKTAEAMRAERRDRARSNRLQAIRPAAEPMPF